jgi:acetyl esterase/lipase
MWIVLLGIGAVVLALMATRRLLSGVDQAPFDLPRPKPMRASPSEESKAVEARVRELQAGDDGNAVTGAERVARLRAAMDEMGAGASLAEVEIRPAAAGGPRAEWVVPDGACGQRRLLYIHGGGFTLGSPASHRPLTTEIARRTGCAVLAVDYRLKPEHPRRAGIEDCRSAWLWLESNGPDGPGPASEMFVAGDSAGGNLTLTLLAWLRDTGGRQADAAIALSPGTDTTLSSKSVRTNRDSDAMLGAAFRGMERIPKPLLLLRFWAGDRIPPNHPDVSPLHGALHGLPPTLVQLSTAEVLRDEGIRYVNKARAAGSAAEVQAWPGMVHVWQMFGPELPEADEAYAQIAEFVARHGRAAAHE